MANSSLDQISNAARSFAEARNTLAALVTELNDGIEALRRDNLPAIRRAITRAADLQAKLKGLVEASPENFVKPKTLVLHGIKVGFEKGRGAVKFDDPAKVVELIRRKLPEMADVLIKSTEKPLKGPLQQLTVQQLKSIGCEVDATGDQVVVRAVESDIEKLVAALLKGREEDDED